MGRPPRRHPGTPHPPQCAHWGTFPPSGGKAPGTRCAPLQSGQLPAGCEGHPGPSEARHRRRPGGPGRYSAAAVRACRVIDAGRPRRGSACHETKKGTGRGCTPGSCFVCTAFRRHEPPYWGARVGEAPRPFFPPISSGRNGGARRAGTRREAGPPPDGRILSAPTGLAVGVPRWSGPPPGDAPVSGQKSAPPGIRAALVFTALRGNTPNQGWQAAACRGCCAGR